MVQPHTERTAVSSFSREDILLGTPEEILGHVDPVVTDIFEGYSMQQKLLAKEKPAKSAG